MKTLFTLLTIITFLQCCDSPESGSRNIDDLPDSLHSGITITFDDDQLRKTLFIDEVDGFQVVFNKDFVLYYSLDGKPLDYFTPEKFIEQMENWKKDILSLSSRVDEAQGKELRGAYIRIARLIKKAREHYSIKEPS